ncbi:hypothetical protein F4677DRAFT_430768 [Hypoxylon crocopeplum]|nr:hypothetical protein F4677DRAFT_430768 [Hypoxylon crocopeplum]
MSPWPMNTFPSFHLADIRIEIPEGTPKMAAQGSRCNAQRLSIEDPIKAGRHNGNPMSFPASRVSSSQLKEYLDRNYPGQYSVQLKRDNFTVTIKEKEERSPKK